MSDFQAVCEEGERISREEGYKVLLAEIAARDKEIERLRLTDAERRAVKWALGEAVWSYNPDCGDHPDTLRRLLTRMSL